MAQVQSHCFQYVLVVCQHLSSFVVLYLFTSNAAHAVPLPKPARLTKHHARIPLPMKLSARFSHSDILSALYQLFRHCTLSLHCLFREERRKHSERLFFSFLFSNAYLRANIPRGQFTVKPRMRLIINCRHFLAFSKCL